jgi:hypothetical protein
MQLAKNRELIEKSGAKTIRAAIKELPETGTDEVKARRAVRKAENSAAGKAFREMRRGGWTPGASPEEAVVNAKVKELSAEDLVKKVEPKVLEKLTENVTKERDFVINLLKGLSVHDVVEALTEAFENKELRELVDGVNEYLPDSEEAETQVAVIAAKAAAQPQSQRRA